MGASLSFGPFEGPFEESPFPVKGSTGQYGWFLQVRVLAWGPSSVPFQFRDLQKDPNPCVAFVS